MYENPRLPPHAKLAHPTLILSGPLSPPHQQVTVPVPQGQAPLSPFLDAQASTFIKKKKPRTSDIIQTQN
jgi:hypothetical protein